MTDGPALVKCLVWDLDNTLWQGTLLEDGEIRLPDAVRATLATLDSRGILNSIASKNDHDHAWARLEELGVAEYFVCPAIGWGPKSDSVRTVAKTLDFALGAIAFVDDQPAERAEVTFHLPEVRCYTAEEVISLVDRPEFDPGTVTSDARGRREMYQARFRREAEQAAFTGPTEEFLRSLELWMRIQRASGDDLSRVHELTLRTSQMNATGVPYADAELRALLDDPRHEVLVTSMGDRFGSHGAVGVTLLAKSERVWHLKLLATSCRVVSFGAGTVILNWLTDEAARAGVHLIADFRRTARNRMMDIAYRFAGFDEQDCACRATLPPAAAEPAVERLHLVPTPRPAPELVALTAPGLAGAGPVSADAYGRG
ncbi:HAD family hydrolase [Actinoplanes sp. DH11]|uniref:HAD-IIIC family phosphatase n=1 Tax=Actinoplanes sp. DH11 TaxID=2857011 RepID=UPI001E50BA43|nr:HAD-IIIC family phosphatase [Actinoplanes sp. DH11]